MVVSDAFKIHTSVTFRDIKFIYSLYFSLCVKNIKIYEYIILKYTNIYGTSK